jgi:hypothetical protein
MRILVTSASGASGNGYGAILGFGSEGEFTGPFSSDPRITDPRGLSLDPSGALVYLNPGRSPYSGSRRPPPAKPPPAGAELTTIVRWCMGVEPERLWEVETITAQG